MKIKEHSESERRKTSRSERRRMDTQHQSSFDKNMETDLWTDEEAEWTDRRSCLFPPIDARKTEDILYEQQRTKEDQRCLLEELARIEQDLKDSIRIEEKRRQEQNQVRREENRIRWRSLSYLSLNQRTAKPWVTSYYKNIPMHIYCLPINTVVRRQNIKKTKR